MSLPLLWELPGGKAEEGENLMACAMRETEEELGYRILVVEELDSFDTTFNGKQYRMSPCVAVVTGGHLHLHEHADAVWQPLDKLFDLDWAPAELRILREWVALTTARKPSVAALQS